VADLANQRKLQDENWEQRKKQAKDPANAGKITQEILKRWEEEHKAALGSLDLLERRSGGKLDANEMRAFTQMQTMTNNMRKSIVAFEDDLTYRYWVFLDGLSYYSFEALYTAGFNMYRAIDSGNNTTDSEERQKALEELKDPAKKKARDDRREVLWQWVPAEIKKVAFDFFRRKEETAEFDSRSFTRKEGKSVVLDTGKWAALRLKLLDDFKKKSQDALDAIDLSRNYQNQKWSLTFQNCREARDSVIAQMFCWELYARQTMSDKEVEAANPDAKELAKMKQEARKKIEEAVIKEWETEAGSAEGKKEMAPYFVQAKTAPAGVKSRFDTAYKAAKNDLDIPDFASRYRYKLEKKQDPGPPRRYKDKWAFTK
jgi:hypothetical protein